MNKHTPEWQSAEPMPDISIRDDGSLVLVTPNTPHAVAWIKANVQDDAQWFGNALVVEHRYADALIEGMINDGLEVA